MFRSIIVNPIMTYLVGEKLALRHVIDVSLDSAVTDSVRVQSIQLSRRECT